MSQRKLCYLLTSLTFFGSIGEIGGAAYQVFPQSTSSTGYAHGDMAALAEDASTAWYNPAGMTRLKESQLQIGATFVNLKTAFSGNLGFSDLQGAVANGGADILMVTPKALFSPFQVPRAKGDTSPVLPGIFFVKPLHYGEFDLAFGIAATSPFGLETDYSSSSVRNYTERTQIQSFSISPSIAIKFGELSIGGGYTREVLRTEFTASFLSFGAVADLHDWRSSWHLSALYELSPFTRVGFSYRPQITHRLVGDTFIGTEHGKAKCQFINPEFWTIGAFHQLNRCWSLMGTFAFTRWEAVDEITVYTGIDKMNVTPLFVELLNGLLDGFTLPSELFDLDSSKALVPLKAKNSFLLALGSKYVIDDTWTLRMGFGFDKTPLQTKTRELRLPDNDRYHFGLGLQMAFNKSCRFDLGFQYIYLPRCGIEENPLLALQFANPVPMERLEELIGDQFGDLAPIRRIGEEIFSSPSTTGFSGKINSSAFVLSLSFSLLFE